MNRDNSLWRLMTVRVSIAHKVQVKWWSLQRSASASSYSARTGISRISVRFINESRHIVLAISKLKFEQITREAVEIEDSEWFHA